MTEETKERITNIIVDLNVKRGELERLVRDTMQDYSDAVEINDPGAQVVTFGEVEHYMEAYASLTKAIKILRSAREASK